VKGNRTGGIVMKRLLELLMVLGLMVGCGGDSESAITKGPEGQTLEVKTEEWDNGNIKVEFQYYRDGGLVVKHGWYKEYGEDGTPRVEWTYYGGKEKFYGKWVYYYDNGNIEREVNYVDGQLEGKWVFYNENGQIIINGNCLDVTGLPVSAHSG
jgi:antitoxin component YwqK of YwqJK toxin-antitoxin module